MVFGVPTIKRERESYLSRTLQSLIDSLYEEESMDCLIVVMVCEVRDTSSYFLSTPSLSGNSFGQDAHSHVPWSLSSISWKQPCKGLRS